MAYIYRIFALLLALLLFAQVLPFSPALAVETETSEECFTLIPEEDILPDPEALFDGYVLRQFYRSEGISFFGVHARAQLRPQEQNLYDHLKDHIQKLASGKTNQASIKITFDELNGFGGELTRQETSGKATEQFRQQFDTRKILTALMHDCPYDMYWYNKQSGTQISTSASGNTSIGYQLNHITILFSVAASYRPSGYEVTSPTTDTGKTGATASALENADKILLRHADKEDYYKLLAYKEEICQLTAYETNVEKINYSANSDPWQLIYVFDGDPETRVVCEGYSKAFQYLCDMSAFLGDVYCYSVTGDLRSNSSTEGHMWNIVELGGACYLADITNSDSGTVGENGGLFLDGVSGSISKGYTAKNATYTYDNETMSLWGTDENSILNLSPTAYSIPEPSTSGPCGEDLNWEYDNTTSTLYITGTGAMENYDRNAPWQLYAAEIQSVLLEDGVTELGNYAFYGCKQLTAMVIPATVDHIGNHAFTGCSKLSDIYFQGDAPQSINGGSFTGIIATVHVNPDRTGWNENTMLNYGGSLTWDGYKANNVTRLSGENRFDTAFMTADAMKIRMNVTKFQNIIVASGANFADALAGSYLAAVKKAPILLSYKEPQNAQVAQYIRDNLATDGTVYILGGPAAVPESMETLLEGTYIKRLAGDNRFETNLKILTEAGVNGQEILVCTGSNFADSLSASASGKPILLVHKELLDSQKTYLESMLQCSFCIVGGTNAVSTGIEDSLAEYGSIFRLAGENRFHTSVLVAERFFSSPDHAVLAYAGNFPDGLCGGALAYAMKAPLLLTATKHAQQAADYASYQRIWDGVVLGGPALISDDAVRTIFDMNNNTAIQ